MCLSVMASYAIARSITGMRQQHKSWRWQQPDYGTNNIIRGIATLDLYGDNTDINEESRHSNGIFNGGVVAFLDKVDN